MNTRYYLLDTLAVVAILFTACSKNAKEFPVDKVVPFEICVGRSDTKALIDESLKQQWENGDEINIFHAVAGSEDYISDGVFTAVGYGQEVTFVGTLSSELTADEYDWYAVYTPNGSTDLLKTSVYIYSYASESSSFMGLANSPLSGNTLGVRKDEKPRIKMSHLTSLACVTVTNGLDYPITLKDVFFYGTEQMTGFFLVNMVDRSFTLDGDNTKKVRCASYSGISIPSGESASVYLEMKPFVAPAGSELKLQVIALNNGRQEKTVTLDHSVAFEAGKVNRMFFTYTKEPSDSPIIAFEDSVMESICVDHFDLNYDNKISVEEAQEVTVLEKNLISQFERDNILSFKELRYFTSLKEIEYGIFRLCTNLESVILPEGLKRIGDNAFEHTTSLTGINLPASLDSIGMNAFSYSALSGDMVIPSEVSFIGQYAFSKTKLNSVRLNDKIKKLENHTFYDCSNLSSVVFGNGLLSIGSNAFQNCSSLKRLEIYSGLNSMGKNVFDGCTSLSFVDIPSSVKLIDSNAFRNCDAIEEFHLHSILPPDTDENAFSGTYSIFVPSIALIIYQNDATWSVFSSRLRGEGDSGGGSGNNEGIGYDEW